MTFPEEDEESVLFQSNETAEQTTPGPTTPTNVRRTKGTPRSGSSGGGSSAKRPQSDKRKHDSMTASERKKDKKDRKTYSTAGRPRSRGEYKCGKCGFYPKKEKVCVRFFDMRGCARLTQLVRVTIVWDSGV